MNYLSEEVLMKMAPSIFSTQSHSKTSDKYQLIPTIECVRKLQENGFYPVKARESRARIKDNSPFVKHLIRFRRQENLHITELRLNVPEIVMTNSHNGLSSYKLTAGIYRQVCSNGLIVGNDLFSRSCRHQGDVVDKVLQSAHDIIEIMPFALDMADSWRYINLSRQERNVFAESASLLKWDTSEIEIEPEKLLRPRRQADVSSDLWTTFNVVQENLIKGGIRYYNQKNKKKNSTREVNSVNENSRLNTSLWNLAEKMAKLTK